MNGYQCSQCKWTPPALIARREYSVEMTLHGITHVWWEKGEDITDRWILIHEAIHRTRKIRNAE